MRCPSVQQQSQNRGAGAEDTESRMISEFMAYSTVCQCTSKVKHCVWCCPCDDRIWCGDVVEARLLCILHEQGCGCEVERGLLFPPALGVASSH
jgi:hypothetical protein